MMETALLNAFIAVAEERSFRRASQRLHLSHSAVSRAVRQLEEQVGAQLLERDTRNVRLSPAGEAFLGEATGALKRLELASANARRIAKGETATVSIGVASDYMDGHVPRIARACQQLKAMFPGVEFRFLSMLSADQAEALRSGALDLGILYLNPVDKREFDWRVIARTPIAVAVPDAWGVTAKSVKLRDLRRWPLILPHPEKQPEAHDYLLRICRSSGFEPNIAAYSDGPITGRIMVATGLGATFRPADSTVTKGAERYFQMIPISDLPKALYLETAAVWADTSTSPQISALVDLLAEPGSAAR